MGAGKHRRGRQHIPPDPRKAYQYAPERGTRHDQIEGTEKLATIRAITEDDVRKFFKDHPILYIARFAEISGVLRSKLDGCINRGGELSDDDLKKLLPHMVHYGYKLPRVRKEEKLVQGLTHEQAEKLAVSQRRECAKYVERNFDPMGMGKLYLDRLVMSTPLVRARDIFPNLEE